MQLDDLDGLVEPGRLGGEPHHEDGAEREVRRHQHAHAGARPRRRRGGDLRLDGGQSAFVPARGPDDAVHPLRHAVGDVAGGRVGHGELHDDVGSPEIPEVVVEVVGTDQAEVRSGPDRCADPGAHPARRADDRHGENA